MVAIGLGSVERSLFVVHSGWLLQRAVHRGGEELILSLLGRGETAGLAEAVLAAPAEKETVAGEDAMVIAIPWRAVAEASASSPEYGGRIGEELARETLALGERLAVLAFSTLEGRVAAFLLEMARAVRRTPSLKLTQAMIASAVGASRPKVNRCLKALEARGAIAWRSEAAPWILDRGALERLL